MGARGLSVHVGGPGGPVGKTNIHVLLHGGDGVDFKLGEVLDEDALVGTFLEVHPGLDVLPEEVVDLLVVDFYKTATYEVSLRCVVFGFGNDLAEGPGDDPAALVATGVAHHGVRFPATGLSIGEDGPVVAVEDALDQEEGTLLVDATLCGVWREDVVEGEVLGLLFVIFFFEIDRLVLHVGVHHAHASCH